MIIWKCSNCGYEIIHENAITLMKEGFHTDANNKRVNNDGIAFCPRSSCKDFTLVKQEFKECNTMIKFDGDEIRETTSTNNYEQCLQDAYQKAVIEELCDFVHERNITWWRDPFSGEPKRRNVGEMLCLITSELCEALEAHRKDLMDDKLPNRKGFEVELADALIRLLDLAGGMNLDLGGAFVEKMAYNAQRPDHKPENRIKPGGKAY